MASIRRTLSPANYDRQSSSFYQNGSSPSNITQWTSKPPNSRFFVELRRIFSGGGSSPPSKSLLRRFSWRKPIYRCLLFFIIGFLIGILHFDNIDDDIRSHDFSFNDNLSSFRRNDVVLRAEEEKKFNTKLLEMPESIDQKVRRNDVVLTVEEEHNFDVKRKRNDVVLMVDEEEKQLNATLVEISEKFDYKPRKLLIIVTPTYNRVLQAYYLNRLGQVLRLVNPPVLWIVVEMTAQSSETAVILRNAGVMYRHLVCRKNSTDVKDRGVHQRNTALQHIEIHRLDGIVYFADDDNVYSLELFESIRDISRFGTWPVAMLAQNKNKAILEGPVCNGSEVIGWHTNEKSKRLRRFHVDMSGFAFNSTILWDPKRWKRPFLNPVRQLDTVKEGFQETTFIEQVVEEESQMEGIPHSCGKIMNWHLHLDARGIEYPRGWILQKNLDPVFFVD